MRTAFPLLSATILLAGCAATPERICQREGPARIGEMAYINGPVVRVESVLEDSRCPVDAQCVHAGDVRIAATVISGNSKKPIELTLGKPLHIADGSLTLLSVAPRKRSDHTITPEMYRFTFDFQGGF